MTSNLVALSADELISKGIAPVKRDFWKPVPVRQEVAAVGSSLAPKPSVPVEKRSKRKAKQVRGGFDNPARLSHIRCRRVRYTWLRGCRNATIRSTYVTIS